MAKVRKLLANAPGRIGRRFAQFVAIAAASLPSAGAYPELPNHSGTMRTAPRAALLANAA